MAMIDCRSPNYSYLGYQYRLRKNKLNEWEALVWPPWDSKFIIMNTSPSITVAEEDAKQWIDEDVGLIHGGAG